MPRKSQSAVDEYLRPRRLIGAMLVRNEAGRWLEQVLGQMQQVCDSVVVLDDASTDATPAICRRMGAAVHTCEESLWATNEVLLRRRLWELAAAEAGPGGWVLNLDADETMEPRSLDWLRPLLPLAEYSGADALVFRLFDMWSETHYRDDRWWTAHRRLWPMLVQVDAARAYRWPDRALHCGRFPENAVTRVYDSGLRLQHWGWSRPEDRLRKHERYVRIDPDGRWGIWQKYQSILDEEPNLVPWR